MWNLLTSALQDEEINSFSSVFHGGAAWHQVIDCEWIRALRLLPAVCSRVTASSQSFIVSLRRHGTSFISTALHHGLLARLCCQRRSLESVIMVNIPYKCSSARRTSPWFHYFKDLKCSCVRFRACLAQSYGRSWPQLVVLRQSRCVFVEKELSSCVAESAPCVTHKQPKNKNDELERRKEMLSL